MNPSRRGMRRPPLRSRIQPSSAVALPNPGSVESQSFQAASPRGEAASDPMAPASTADPRPGKNTKIVLSSQHFDLMMGAPPAPLEPSYTVVQALKKMISFSHTAVSSSSEFFHSIYAWTRSHEAQEMGSHDRAAARGQSLLLTPTPALA